MVTIYRENRRTAVRGLRRLSQDCEDDKNSGYKSTFCVTRTERIGQALIKRKVTGCDETRLASRPQLFEKLRQTTKRFHSQPTTRFQSCHAQSESSKLIEFQNPTQ